MDYLIHNQITKYWLELKASNTTNNQEDFNALMLHLIPEFKKYIQHNLKVEFKRGHIKKGRHEIDEFISKIFIEAYDRFSDFSDSDKFSNWLYIKLDELMDEVAVQDQFDDFFFKNIDAYTQIEWDTMEEEYTVDGGGDFVMIEELEGKLSDKYDYTLKDVFIEEKDKTLITKLDKTLGRERVDRHIKLVLSKLPLVTRNLFDLAATQKLLSDDIAEIKKLSLSAVDKTLFNIRENLKLSFANRYKTDD